MSVLRPEVLEPKNLEPFGLALHGSYAGRSRGMRFWSRQPFGHTKPTSVRRARNPGNPGSPRRADTHVGAQQRCRRSGDHHFHRCARDSASDVERCCGRGGSRLSRDLQHRCDAGDDYPGRDGIDRWQRRRSGHAESRNHSNRRCHDDRGSRPGGNHRGDRLNRLYRWNRRRYRLGTCTGRWTRAALGVWDHQYQRYRINRWGTRNYTSERHFFLFLRQRRQGRVEHRRGHRERDGDGFIQG